MFHLDGNKYSSSFSDNFFFKTQKRKKWVHLDGNNISSKFLFLNDTKDEEIVPPGWKQKISTVYKSVNLFNKYFLHLLFSICSDNNRYVKYSDKN